MNVTQTLFSHIIYFSLVLLIFTSCAEKSPAVTQLTVQQKSCLGFETTGSNPLPIFWVNEFPIKIHLSTTFPEEHKTAVLEAIDIWNLSLNKMIFTLSEERDRSQTPHKNNKNTIYWLNPWPYDIERIGSTFLHTIQNNIKEADIAINAQDYEISNENTIYIYQYNLRSLIVHELGHILGLDHNDESLSSIMKTHLDPTTLYHQVGHIDIENLNCMYQL